VIWDPTVVGPLDRCLRCFRESGAEFIVCKTCGVSSGTLEVPLDASGAFCYGHQTQAASAYCGWCARPVCHLCVERQGLNLVGIGLRTYCKNCVTKQAAIEKAFFQQLERSGSCAKHESNPSTFRCARCALPLCDLCSYFITGGVFRARLRSGPLCLTCFRTATLSRGRNQWISGSAAREKGLLSQR